MSVCEKYRKVETKAAIARAGSLDLVTVRLLTPMGIKKKEGPDDVLINSLEEWNNLKNIPGWTWYIQILSTTILIGLGLIIVDVYTQWAGPCDVMKPIINKVKSSVKLILSTSC